MRRRMTQEQYQMARAATVRALDATGARSLPLDVAGAVLPDVPEWDDYIKAPRRTAPRRAGRTVRP